MRNHPLRPRSLGTLLAAALALTFVPPVAEPFTTSARADTAARADAAARPKVTESADGLTLSVPGTGKAPGYTVDVATDELALTTERSGKTVLGTAGGDTGGLRFRSDERWEQATAVTDWTWKDGVLTLTADTTLTGATVEARLTPEADRYQLDWDVEGGSPDQLGLAYDLSSAGHWYGHGEAETPQGGPGVNQPWPLDAGEVEHETFGPASYNMIDPFWYTSRSTGLHVDTGHVMDVAIDKGRDGLGTFTVESPDTYKATVFVESTPLEVYRDYIGIVGKPTKSDATYEQYAKPLWNSWAQFYTKIDQEKLLDYATDLHDNGLDGHTIQLDDKWESNYGNLTWDPKTFPDPKGLSKKIHDMGFDFGIWVTLWINLDSDNYQYAVDNGYLLMDAKDTSKPCEVTWWNGQAGIIDLANPDAKAWYEGNLEKLMDTYDIDGLKFDTRFFDEKCAPREGHQATDYQKLGTELADEFDLQGAGIRVHWNRTAHEAGFVTRQVDKGTGWDSLRASTTQNLAISTIGYPFVESDMIGGSGGQPAPTKDVLVRWAQSASLMPLMYASTSPVDTNDTTTGQKVDYDQETVDLYREAIETHEKLAPYIWDQVQSTLKTGDPIMRPLFFDFPKDEASYTVTDEWMLGPAVLAAPKLSTGATRSVHLPPGTWYDVNQGTVIRGPRTLKGYAAPLGVTPAFVNLKAKGAAKAVKALKRDDAPAASVLITPDAPATDAGTPFQVTTEVTNWSTGTLRNAKAALDLPDGWTAQATGPTTAKSLKNGTTLTTTWTVTPADDARWGSHDLTGTATYTGHEGSQKVSDTVPAQVKAAPGSVQEPYLTADTTSGGARYAQAGDQFAIWAGGQDLSGWKDEKGVIYRDDAAGAKATVQARLVSQNSASPVGKAGIALANDLTAPEKGGYAVLVMTQSYGLEFMTDSDGDGKLDTWAGGGSTYHPAYLKLTRDGATYTAYAGKDGETWSQVGTAQVPSAAGTGDAGMVASAANVNYPGENIEAVFSGFSVTS
ncbi:glycoside hydrolase family 31 protein [Streptomyces europaeiscabiei]|uniref:TIM-barrel domain-containing protein n=1 Tax=Streptomyces europaeiscabiei TaxID=146819 RepID=UPI0029B59E8A|nr:TIM-barrel domain-containing protein [Streptomyces europaeiscabiei]MDX3694399.1 glycoside hydrolase family 31 protein [Streptomyces europaeiscabiei]